MNSVSFIFFTYILTNQFDYSIVYKYKLLEEVFESLVERRDFLSDFSVYV